VLREREAALRELGSTARGTSALGERARLYGALLATCAECHDAAEVVIPVPDVPPSQR
jgi:cytochrome c553